MVHVMSCYAPTFAASREKKDSFYGRLQEVLSSMPYPSQECYVLLLDFNARVGLRSECIDEWWDERGRYGYGVLNGTGRGVSFLLHPKWCYSVQHIVQKKAIQKHTIMRKSQSWRCLHGCGGEARSCVLR